MTRDEYSVLFHKHQLNLVAFKRLMDCNKEVLTLVNAAIEAEREACAKVCDEQAESPALAPLEKYRADFIADAIRARGNSNAP